MHESIQKCFNRGSLSCVASDLPAWNLCQEDILPLWISEILEDGAPPKQPFLPLLIFMQVRMVLLRLESTT